MSHFMVIASVIFFSRPLFTEQEAYTHSIVVSNLPRDVQEEELREYFERRREHGGGPVKDMRLNTQRGEAIVNFTDYRGIKKANHNAHWFCDVLKLNDSKKTVTVNS